MPVAAGSGAATQYFNSQWDLIAVGQINTDQLTQNINMIPPDGAKFTVAVNISEDGLYETEVYESFDSGGGYISGTEQAKAYRLDASVYEVKGSGELVKMVSLSTRKYLRTG